MSGQPVPLNRRGFLVSLGASMASLALLAACSSTATSAVASRSTSVRPIATTSGTTTTSSAAQKTSSISSSAVKAATTSATQQSVASTRAAPTGKKGEVTWLVRTSLEENKWETTVVEPGLAKVYPNIHLNVIVAPWVQFDPKLFTLFAAGTPVDVWSHWGQSGFADYVHKGMVADLTPYINADHYDLNAFVPGLAAIYKVQGKYYGLPNDASYGVPLIYNQSILQKAGLTPPGQDWTKPWTWEQMVEAAKKMTTNYGAPTATYGVRISTDLQLLARLGGINLYTWSVTESGGIATPSDYHADAPQVLTAVQAVYDLMYKERVMPTPQLGSELSSGNLGPMRAGRLGMNWTAGWVYITNILHQVHDFRVVPAADPKLKTNVTTEYTDPWMLSSKSKTPEASWTFITYLLSYDSQVAYAKVGGGAPANAKAVSVWLQTLTEPTGLTVAHLTQVVQGALKDSKESYNHLLVNYDQLSTAENQAMSNVWNGKTTPADGLRQAKAAVDAVLAKMQG